MIATDLGTPPLSSSTGVFVSVGNVQDELPRFVNSSYSGAVPEGAGSVGASILQVRYVSVLYLVLSTSVIIEMITTGTVPYRITVIL